MRLLDANGMSDIEYAEPFAGGGAVGLGLLFHEYATAIHLNDLARPVYAVWHTILHETEWLCKRIRNVSVNMSEWHKRRKVYDRRADADLADLGFAALFLNRTNRSGILGGGVIGGKGQSGEWSLDVRFNKDALIERIRRIGRYRDRIHIYQLDGLVFTKKVAAKLPNKSFVFYDPPYINHSYDLYLNRMQIEDHDALATNVARLSQPWIVTYDGVAVKNDLYSQFRRLVYDISHMAKDNHKGREVMYFSPGLKLPRTSDFLGDRIKCIPNLSRLKGIA